MIQSLRPLAFSLLAALALSSAGPARAMDASASAEKARSLVAVLRERDDERARRDLYQIGAPSLAPLAEALSEETKVPAFGRLAETFDAVLRARLQDLDGKLAREGRGATATAAPTATALPETPAVIAVKDEIRSAGYAAARELAREAGVRDDADLETRAALLEELRSRLGREAAEPTTRDALARRLANLGAHAAPLLAAAIAQGPPDLRRFAEHVVEIATGRLLELFASKDPDERSFATEQLFGLAELARPALEPLARGGGPDGRYRAERLLRRIDWSSSEELVRRTGRLLGPDFEAQPWTERRMITYELEKQGGVEAVPTLHRILERDPSVSVKVAAAEALAREGDRAGTRFLTTLGLAPLTLSPEVLAAIAMDQGIRFLQIRRYDLAIREFERVLSIEPTNEIAFYNLACAHALRYAQDKREADREKAFEELDLAVSHGFDDADQIEKDEDLTSLRADPRWKALAARARLRKAQQEKNR